MRDGMMRDATYGAGANAGCGAGAGSGADADANAGCGSGSGYSADATNGAVRDERREPARDEAPRPALEQGEASPGSPADAAAPDPLTSQVGAALQGDVPALEFERVGFAYPAAGTPQVGDADAAACPAAPQVFSGVTARIPAGAFALLVGDTGSGKSTLLSLVKPQIAPAGTRTGEIRVLGRSVESMGDEESARTVGFVFQDPETQVVSDTVWHEMAFGLENLGTPQDEMRRRVAEVAYFLGMESWFRQGTDALSGGRKQLLAIASTLAMRPSLLLLDEPTSQLDPIAEKALLHALFRINRELGCTVVVATHHPQPMVDYATCAFRLEDGSLRAVEHVDNLRARPVIAPEAACVEGAARGASGEDAAAGARESTDDRGCSDGRGLAADHLSIGVPNGSASVPRGGLRPGPAAASGAVVQVDRVWHRHARDADWVLRGLDLEVRSRSIHALVGGNGSGKTTLLSLMAGIRKPSRGSVRVAPRGVALLPQDPRGLFAMETAADELMEWAAEGGYGAAEAHEMLGSLGLDACGHVHPYDLSGGQRQLLALGKILLMRPELLLLDEPTKGLDTAARELVARIVRRHRAAGGAVVLATHDLDFVRDVADEVSMLFDGEIACTDPAPAFFRDNLFYRV